MSAVGAFPLTVRPVAVMVAVPGDSAPDADLPVPALVWLLLQVTAVVIGLPNLSVGATGELNFLLGRWHV